MKKATGRKGKEADVHVSDKELEGYRAFDQRGRLDPPQYPKGPRKFTLLPMPMVELYAYLLKKKLVTLIFMRPKDGPPLPGFDPSKKYGHHFGSERHTLEECTNLRNQIQDLIDDKSL